MGFPLAQDQADDLPISLRRNTSTSQSCYNLITDKYVYPFIITCKDSVRFRVLVIAFIPDEKNSAADGLTPKHVPLVKLEV